MRPGSLRLYTDLAWLWPLWGDHETEYADYSAHVAGLILQHARRPVESMLVISCGSGKNVFNLKRQFKVVGLDLSPTMLALAAELNPDCEFVVGDMCSFDLGRRFDAILLDDGISHMTARTDLAAAFRTTFLHLEPGGVMIATPDVIRENFVQNRTVVEHATGAGARTGVDVVFVENVYDPDPDDEHYEATMVYLIRERGVLRVETDRCELGLFAIADWRASLAEAGFLVEDAHYRQDDIDYINFICRKPLDPAGFAGADRS